ncbi:YtxH domain-containing protein [Candidatus Poribacteria bacterium]|nr:YtxH domain-containing protein [Candidatus Poribacteria bacterium]
MAENGNNNATSMLLAFLAGGLVGFGLGLLFAPLSGRETRERIRSASQEVKERTIETASKAKEKVGDLVEHGREKVEGLVEHGKEIASDAKESVKSTLEAGKDAFHRTKAELISGIKSNSSEES